MKRLELIKKISREHPVYGVERGLSTYTGGMADTGHWFTDKLVEAPINVLEGLWAHMSKENRKPKIIAKPVSGKILHYNGSWIHEQKLIALRNMKKDFEHSMAFVSKNVAKWNHILMIGNKDNTCEGLFDYVIMEDNWFTKNDKKVYDNKGIFYDIWDFKIMKDHTGFNRSCLLLSKEIDSDRLLSNTSISQYPMTEDESFKKDNDE